MAIPDYQTIMYPLMKLMADGKQRSMRDVVEHLADEFRLSEEERNALLPSGSQRTFNTRVSWARTYLKKAKLLESPRSGFIQITERGKGVVAKTPDRIDNEFLMQYPEFVAFRTGSSKPINTDTAVGHRTVTSKPPSDLPPEEQIQISYNDLVDKLAQEILEAVMDCSPEFFERLVVELLVKMGYGGSREDAGQAVGRSGDEGIDGLIKEDKLGLDTVYIQAKRWQGSVGRSEIQKFAGALQGKRAKKGVFITTSDFTRNARDYAENIENKIALIDGNALAKLMIENDIGVSRVTSYEIKRLDSDYFEVD